MALDYGAGGNLNVSLAGPFSGGGGAAVKLTSISLPAADWKGGESPYYQVVNVDGVSVNSMVNLNPSVEEMGRFHNQYIEFTAKNDGGIVTLYAIGDKPAADGVFQAIISDLVNIGKSDGAVIWGNTVCTPAVRTNWNQEDPTKADYLKGRDALEMLIQNAQNAADDANMDAFNAQIDATKAQLAAENAQGTANDAKTAADNAATAAGKALTAAVSKTNATITLSANGWAKKEQTVNVPGVTTDEDCDVLITPGNVGYLSYLDCVVRGKEQGDGTVTFICEDVPEEDVSANIMILSKGVKS